MALHAFKEIIHLKEGVQHPFVGDLCSFQKRNRRNPRLITIIMTEAAPKFPQITVLHEVSHLHLNGGGNIIATGCLEQGSEILQDLLRRFQLFFSVASMAA